MYATWCRLDNGKWGVCVESALGPLFDAIVGQEIDVTRRDGDVSKQLVTKIVKRLEPRPAKRVRGRTIKEVTKFLAFCEVEERPKTPTRKGSAKRNGTSRHGRKPSWNSVEFSMQVESSKLALGAYAATRAGLRSEPVAPLAGVPTRELLANVSEVRIPAEEMAAAERCLRPQYGWGAINLGGF